ncbi:hypothetical protein [Endothiovibrio diazotrophicus]
MKIKTLAWVMAIGLGWGARSAPAAEWECGKMKSFVDVMYKATDFLNSHPSFDEDPKLEQSLDQLLPILAQIAREEEIDSFTDAVQETQTIWAKEEWVGDDIGDFRRAFDATTVNLERVYERYCP